MMTRKKFITLSVQATAIALTYNLISCKKEDTADVQDTLLNRLENNNKIYILGSRKEYKAPSDRASRINLSEGAAKSIKKIERVITNKEIVGYLCLNKRVAIAKLTKLKTKKINKDISLIYFKETQSLMYTKEQKANLFFIKENEINYLKPYYI